MCWGGFRAGAGFELGRRWDLEGRLGRLYRPGDRAMPRASLVAVFGPFRGGRGGRAGFEPGRVAETPEILDEAGRRHVSDGSGCTRLPARAESHVFGATSWGATDRPGRGDASPHPAVARQRFGRTQNPQAEGWRAMMLREARCAPKIKNPETNLRSHSDRASRRR